MHETQRHYTVHQYWWSSYQDQSAMVLALVYSTAKQTSVYITSDWQQLQGLKYSLYLYINDNSGSDTVLQVDIWLMLSLTGGIPIIPVLQCIICLIARYRQKQSIKWKISFFALFYHLISTIWHDQDERWVCKEFGFGNPNFSSNWPSLISNYHRKLAS